MKSIQKITSPSNPKIREAGSFRIRKNPLDPRFFIEGPHLVDQALAGNSAAFSSVFFSTSFLARDDGKRLLGCFDVRTCFEVPDDLMRKIADTEHPQGIAAIVALPALSLDTLSLPPSPLLVVLDAIQDPGNLGTIIRTADAAGASAVFLLPGTCDHLSAKAVRATAGSVFHVPALRTAEDELLAWLRQRAILIAATAAGAGQDMYGADLRQPVAFVFGNEARGVRPSFLTAAGMILSIPILGKAESLNVAASSAIMLYEAVRQRRQG
ncbi:MAG: RNA methyltransferase [Thermodesulfovibrionales bacterium]